MLKLTRRMNETIKLIYKEEIVLLKVIRVHYSRIELDYDGIEYILTFENFLEVKILDKLVIVTLETIWSNHCRIGFKCDKEIKILRGELEVIEK